MMMTMMMDLLNCNSLPKLCRQKENVYFVDGFLQYVLADTVLPIRILLF
jgi:hypothetical protein